MKVFSFILAVALLLLVFAGCGKGDGAEEGSLLLSPEKEIENLVADGEFANGGKDWILEGDIALSDKESKGNFDSRSLVFTGEGKALYTIKDVEPGTYSLRFFLKGQGEVPPAEMTVQVDGKGVAKIPYTPFEGWFEYASGAIEVSKKGVVTLILQVKSENASSSGNFSTTSKDVSSQSGGMAQAESVKETFRLFLDGVRFLKLPQGANPEPVAGDDPVSFLAKREDGSFYMNVNGAPYLYRRVDIGFIDDNFEQSVARAAEAGFEVFTVTLPWKDVQSTNNENSLNFDKIDVVLLAAERNNIRADIVWAGSSYNGTVELAPLWLQYDHTLHSKGEKDKCETILTGRNANEKQCIADFGNKKLLEYESKAIKGLIEYIGSKDVDRRIVGIQLQHNPAIAFYASRVQGYEAAARYLDELGKIIKDSDRPMLVRVNSPEGLAPHFAFNTQHIDFNVCEVNSQSMALILTRFDSYNSRVPALFAGAVYGNTSSQIVASYLKGAAISLKLKDIEALGQDEEDYRETAEYRSIRNLNFAAAKVEGPLVLATNEQKTGFNYSIDKPLNFLNEIKECSGVFIKCQNLNGNAPVSIAFVNEGAVYSISDSMAYFSVYGTLGTASVGSFTRQGAWTDGEVLLLNDNLDGSFGAVCGEGQALRIQVVNSGKPIQAAH